jgi:maleate cis-trans isomerase
MSTIIMFECKSALVLVLGSHLEEEIHSRLQSLEKFSVPAGAAVERN